MSYDLKGRKAIVTGGAGGIGRAAALMLAKAGAAVTIVDLDESGGEAVVRKILQAGGKGMFVRGDVSRASCGAPLWSISRSRTGIWSWRSTCALCS